MYSPKNSVAENTLLNNSLAQMLQNIEQEAERVDETPAEWIERHFYVPDPRDPITDERFPSGPLRLAEHQRRIINEALSRKEDGTFKYTTIIYSAPKKSGKSALASAVMMYLSQTFSHAYIACAANDGKQSDDRLYGPVKTCFQLHKQRGGIFQDVHYTNTHVILPNYTKIEPINVDAAGEAGSQPLGTFFSELWGFTTEKKKRLWTELTPPPTLHGYAIRWVETYAGFKGESELLEQLYDLAIEQGSPHPDFLDLQGENGPVVTVNERAGIFCYWDTEPRMAWQTDDYYQEQAATLSPSEFQRIHRNMWVSSTGAFIQEEWWDACEDLHLPEFKDNRTPVVVGIDMAVTRDCAALIAVTRDPFEPDTRLAVRGVRVFSPKASGGIINQEQLIRPVIEQWAKKWNVVCWVYDPREMSKLAQDMTREGFGWFKPFGQQQPRAIADKSLHDMILAQQISWNRSTTEGDIGMKGDPRETLYKHVTQAGSTANASGYRIEKLSANTHIDAAVALSMAASMAMTLSIDNQEMEEVALIRELQRGEITLDEFSRKVRSRHPKLEDRLHGRD